MTGPDPRLVFLARAWRGYVFVEAGEMDLDEAIRRPRLAGLRLPTPSARRAMGAHASAASVGRGRR